MIIVEMWCGLLSASLPHVSQLRYVRLGVVGFSPYILPARKPVTLRAGRAALGDRLVCGRRDGVGKRGWGEGENGSGNERADIIV
ncbi:hypothetical protein BIFGAL_03664 [Bifidobacterium gallicum DSM 20093 = LMG 11596]|uniref:Uncharacterized protein n=1 Tax=Bifidobacterium gallicum DSM 20093 = LMG 11596 TaxID=561180 RepID=D1NUY6_9BIFI|nr:hypothetical protein BIFGAL_03664 [Bifidobacterium gallicum DSM 20093 = LMG 11596]